MAVAANRSFEILVQFLANWMICFETKYVRFTTIETARRVPQLLAAHFNTPSPRDGVGVLHAATSGLT